RRERARRAGLAGDLAIGTCLHARNAHRFRVVGCIDCDFLFSRIEPTAESAASNTAFRPMWVVVLSHEKVPVAVEANSVAAKKKPALVFRSRKHSKVVDAHFISPAACGGC